MRRSSHADELDVSEHGGQVVNGGVEPQVVEHVLRHALDVRVAVVDGRVTIVVAVVVALRGKEHVERVEPTTKDGKWQDLDSLDWIRRIFCVTTWSSVPLLIRGLSFLTKGLTQSWA